MSNIRLAVPQKLSVCANIILSPEQSHYLSNVMRCSKGEIIKCFNSNDGEFLSQIKELHKNKTIVETIEQIRKPQKESDIWLLFVPLKKDKTDFVVEKAVELGVSKIIPVLSSRANVKQIKTDRYVLQATEAAEQCGRLSIPEVDQPQDLFDVLSNWDKNRWLYFMDERRNGNSAVKIFNQNKKGAILIGPEGGFSEEEAEKINQNAFVENISLGPRILRAETAAIASLAVWQAIAGDWYHVKE